MGMTGKGYDRRPRELSQVVRGEYAYQRQAEAVYTLRNARGATLDKVNTRGEGDQGPGGSRKEDP